MTPERWRQIKELYQAAREPAKRAHVLAAADPELRSEVESLLAQESSTAGILDQPAWADVAELEGTESKVTSIIPGIQIGPYRIEGLLGAGGMSEVFRAVDSKFNRPVAIKFLSAHLADAAARRRFQREAQMASSAKSSTYSDCPRRRRFRGPAVSCDRVRGRWDAQGVA